MNPLLDGLKVLDLSRLLPGPFCSLSLAQLGADVIKIEEPDGGDYARELSPELFDIVNRGKQSLTLDLRQAEDVARFKQLVETADVVLESFRPGVMDKLGCRSEEHTSELQSRSDLVCRLLLEKKKKKKTQKNPKPTDTTCNNHENK